ncbi:MAG TPA: hypothetical protein VIY27_06175 [Myxococcota bacterium]
MNADGFADLVSHYRTQETGLSAGPTQACVSGRTRDAWPIEGCGAIRIAPR